MMLTICLIFFGLTVLLALALAFSGSEAMLKPFFICLGLFFLFATVHFGRDFFGKLLATAFAPIALLVVVLAIIFGRLKP